MNLLAANTKNPSTSLISIAGRSVLAAIVSIQVTIVPWTAQAAGTVRCESLFLSTPESGTLLSVLPQDLLRLTTDLKPKELKKLQERFEKRDALNAEREAIRLVTRLLKDDFRDEKLLIRDVLTKRDLHTTFNRVSHARLDRTSMEVRLENALLEIGYGEGSPKAQKWSAFRRRYFRQLEMIRRVAINTTANFLAGIPIEMRRNQYLQFQPSKTHRREWTQTERRLRAKIEFRDPQLVRDFHREIVVNFALRVLAYAVLALIADEFAEFLFPEWRVLKSEVFGPGLESRHILETKAYDTWKGLMEAFTGQIPDDSSDEAVRIKKQIRESTLERLWLHIYEGAPLSEPADKAPAAAPAPAPSAGSPSTGENPLYDPYDGPRGSGDPFEMFLGQ